MYKFSIVFIFLLAGLYGESAYPVDLSFLVADIKYSQEHGIKICEVQQGICSSFKGDVFSHGGEPVIAQNLIDALAIYVHDGWTVPKYHCDKELKRLFDEQENWHAKKSRNDIFYDPEFLAEAVSFPIDPERIEDYSGFVYLKCTSKQKLDKLQKAYPGIVFIDRATAPYWVDKAKVSALFELDPLLSEIKPKWSTYPATYSPALAKRIKAELGSVFFVIKPKGAFLGRGVIIVSDKELDAVLKYILNPSKELKSDPDHSFNYWYGCKDDEFIVEQFYPSDPVSVPHLDHKLYQPTMRVTFLCGYSQGEVVIHYLGGYWLLPKNALEEGGSLNEMHKGHCVLPHYMAVDPSLEEKIAKECQIPFSLFYQKMLENPIPIQ